MVIVDLPFHMENGGFSLPYEFYQLPCIDFGVRPYT